jgi:phosphoglycolate phosphatase
MKHSKRLIVFDWDGTLMDSQARIVNCFRAAIEDMQLAARTDAQLSDVIGLGFSEALHRLYPDESDHFHQDLVQCYRHYFLHSDDTPSALFTGAMELLEELNKDDYFVAVATGKGRQGLDVALHENNVAHLIHASRCADETRSKPNPQMLEELMEYFALEPQQALMIGDTEYDLEMAQNARMHGIAVTHGVHSQQRLEQFEPLTCVANLNDLRSWLDTNITSKMEN